MLLEVLKDSAFSAAELSGVVTRMPYKPDFLGTLGIFAPKYKATTVVGIEASQGQLALIQSSLRGAPLAQRKADKRTMSFIETIRIAKGSRVHAHELQNIRAFGSETEFKQVQDEIDARMLGLRQDVEATHELHRFGAIQGFIKDADGTTIVDLFAELGIAQPSTVAFALPAGGTASDGAIRTKCNALVRAMARGAKGNWRQGSEVGVLVDDDFFDKLTAAKETRETYLNQVQAQELRGGLAWGEFRYAGCRFFNLRGTDDGVGITLASLTGRAFPIGTDAFEVAFSPGESFDEVNKPGQAVYAKMILDNERNQWADCEMYSYPLHYCKLPETLIPVTG